jgi:hypothetical protein
MPGVERRRKINSWYIPEIDISARALKISARQADAPTLAGRAAPARALATLAVIDQRPLFWFGTCPATASAASRRRSENLPSGAE